MNYFRYKLIAPSGELFSGTTKLPYEDLLSAISHLERDGSLTLYVKKLGILRSFITKLGSFQFRKKIKRSAQAELLSNLSLMLRSGITLTAALEEIADSLQHSEIKNDLKNIILSVQAGTPFSEAAEKYSYIFPTAVIHLIKIGEETGKLDEMLESGAQHLKRVQGIVSDTKQALMYPAVVFVVLGAGFIFWVYYVAPKIIDLFRDMEVELPAITVFVMKVSYFFRDYLVHILIVVLLMIFSVLAIYKGSRWVKRGIDAMILKLPVAGTIISASSLAFISEYFSLLMNAGVDLLHSMTILKKSIANEIYREKLDEIRKSLKRGESITDSFRGGVIFPSYVIRMINIGEMSGTLSEQLASVAGEYRKKLSTLVAVIGKMLEPVILVIAGVLFGVIIVGLLLPIYDLVSQVSG
ncbi:MAG: type II secretion system F family protein [Thermodesulfobacteriota bacterium]|nr:type II secretion system F family protein [Thermodesulfobacteriota bacterium]